MAAPPRRILAPPIAASLRPIEHTSIRPLTREAVSGMVFQIGSIAFITSAVSMRRRQTAESRMHMLRQRVHPLTAVRCVAPCRLMTGNIGVRTLLEGRRLRVQTRAGRRQQPACALSDQCLAAAAHDTRAQARAPWAD